MHAFKPITLVFLLLSSLVQADIGLSEVKIEALSPLDITYMAQQRQTIADLVGRHTGSRLKGSEVDIPNLQLLIDRRIIKPADQAQMQALGLTLGDVLANKLDMRWIVYIDRRGRSKALRLSNTNNYLFPITMLSRRANGGADISVREIYDKAVAKMQPYIKKGPFDY
ncbi:MAG: DUF3806 domain-containing protein [Pseudomonadales bacterium]